MVRFALVFLWLGLLASPTILRAQDPVPSPSPLKIGITGFPPFLTQEGGVWSGVTISVWEQVAARNSWSFTYVPYTDVEQAVKDLREHKIDIIAGNISIVAELSRKVDYSQPYFRSGLQIMISDSRPHTFKRMLEDLDEFGHLKVLWYVLGGIALFTALVTLFERKHNPDFPKAWPDSIAEAFYYVVSLSLGKSAYKGFSGWFGRLVMVFWTVLAVFVVAYVTSSITSVMTVEKLTSHIHGPNDLPGHIVGVIAESAAIPYLEKKHLGYDIYPDLDSAVQALVDGRIAALVGAAPVLQYYDNMHPNLPITEVGPIFAPYNYGFAVWAGSPLRLPLNEALLTLQESGALMEIGRSYFGEVYQP